MSGPTVMMMNEPARTIMTTTDNTPSVAATLAEISAAATAASQHDVDKSIGSLGAQHPDTGWNRDALYAIQSAQSRYVIYTS